MSEIIGFDITPDSGSTLRKMLKNNLDPVLEEFEGLCLKTLRSSGAIFNYNFVLFLDKQRAKDIRLISSSLLLCVCSGISNAASKEFGLERAMQKMADEWEEIYFNTTQYRDSGKLLISSEIWMPIISVICSFKTYQQDFNKVPNS